MNDAHLMHMALPMPTVDLVPEPVIVGTHLISVALPLRTVDPQQQIDDMHTMPGDPRMPATQAEQQRTTISTNIASPAIASFQLTEKTTFRESTR
ncbi:unnamed protein product [Aphanomyces euteiches]